MDHFYLQHYVVESIGRVKIAEYGCRDEDEVERRKREITERYPSDRAEFVVRRHGGQPR